MDKSKQSPRSQTGFLSSSLNHYKIQFVQFFAQVFSETASRTETYDIRADSAWYVGGHWYLMNIEYLCR